MGGLFEYRMALQRGDVRSVWFLVVFCVARAVAFYSRRVWFLCFCIYRVSTVFYAGANKFLVGYHGQYFGCARRSFIGVGAQ